jgi:16S rRNA processing protein RimM
MSNGHSRPTPGRIAVGVIRKPHGVRGEASVELWTNSPGRFDELTSVTLVSPNESSTREARIASARAHGDRVLVKFEGFDAPEAIDPFRNWTIEIPESEARELEENEYFLHDLVGLTLVDAEGREQGEVVEVLEGGGGILLQVQRGERKFDVPFASEICTKIDLASKTITVNLPDGIDEN